jgi:hypothetical protein
MKLAALLAIATSSCQLVGPAHHTRANASPAAAPPRDVEPDAAGPWPCPNDLAIDQGNSTIPRALDPTRHGSYGKARFATDHQKPIFGDASFAIDADSAVAAALEVEAKHQTLIPSGFRRDLATAPRDPALRLRMARCELVAPHLVQRASIDLGLAILLGAPERQVEQLADMIGDPPECRDPASSMQACIPARERWGEAAAVAKISAIELDLETAVSRGLAGLGVHGDEPRAAGVVVFELMHRCGVGSTCHATKFSVAGTPRMVHWDRRDGGAEHEMKPSASQQRSNKRCHDATGWESQESCLQACWSGGLAGREAETCRTRCYASCDPHD